MSIDVFHCSIWLPVCDVPGFCPSGMLDDSKIRFLPINPAISEEAACKGTEAVFPPPSIHKYQPYSRFCTLAAPAALLATLATLLTALVILILICRGTLLCKLFQDPANKAPDG
ncbi:hypothetical protein [Pararhizobium sp. PWRC1-1]|uniref:hypothetical protein n=1 Tax=Pararhizobium sp. PWRC1-1 TaxID=2804566 RepID=UPI003CEAE24F